ncbi:hypothetical protein GLOIN_2v1822626 [Rhizophagus clarus]|uniref:Uncharacterized protein n=1 Tax=Rhizophagus clarus TaxID=94130 RepID=A0A8H3L268_9GLOM|nr:hypothetical protein GLOIN_2v1822626 [Rhizophagus clarus]
MAQQSVAQKAQVLALQTVEPVKQLRGPPAFTKSEEDMRDYHISKYLKNLGFLSKEEIDSDYPVKFFQRPRHSKRNYPKGLVTQSNFTQSYFMSLKSIVLSDSDSEKNDGDDYDEENNRWSGYDPPVKKNRALKEKSKKDEWFLSLQYLNTSINDLSISEFFLDNRNEFDGFNLATSEVLKWKVDKPSKFAIKGNSEHTSEALEWYTNVAVTLKDMKQNLIITIVGNYACVDNSELKLMLWLRTTGIRKVKGISDPTKNQFCIEDHGKIYIIPTFSKTLVIKDLPKEEQDQSSCEVPFDSQVFVNSSSLTSEKRRT